MEQNAGAVDTHKARVIRGRADARLGGGPIRAGGFGRLSRSHRFAVRLLVALPLWLLAPLPALAQTAADNLGTSWSLCATIKGRDYCGTATRREGTNVFDADWGNGATSVLTVSGSGDQVTVQRVDPAARGAPGCLETWALTIVEGGLTGHDTARSQCYGNAPDPYTASDVSWSGAIIGQVDLRKQLADQMAKESADRIARNELIPGTGLDGSALYVYGAIADIVSSAQIEPKDLDVRALKFCIDKAAQETSTGDEFQAFVGNCYLLIKSPDGPPPDYVPV